MLNRAKKLKESGDLIEAFRIYRHASLDDANTTEAWKQLGQGYAASQKRIQAIRCYEKALALADEWETHLLCAQNLIKLGRYETAKDHLHKAVALNPNSSMVWYELAYYHQMIGQLSIALKEAEQAEQLAENIPDITYMKACILLAEGIWKKGWELYESRLLIRTPNWQQPEPTWNGESLNGKSLHLFCEQGFGDVIQFVRFLPLLPNDCKILFLVPKEMRRLFDESIHDSRVTMYNHGTPPPFVADYSLTLASLPHRCKTDELLPQPYIKAPQNGPLVDKPENIKYTVGIVWKGDTKHQNDPLRSANLVDFVDALALPGVELYSLQIVREEEDGALLGPMGLVQDLSPQIKDFGDTAKLIEQLDCVVTVDTAVAHLAGAMGKECHVLIPFGAVDWRWMHHRTDSPWYPSVTLWRQKENEPWLAVLKRIAKYFEG